MEPVAYWNRRKQFWFSCDLQRCNKHPKHHPAHNCCPTESVLGAMERAAIWETHLLHFTWSGVLGSHWATSLSAAITRSRPRMGERWSLPRRHSCGKDHSVF